VSGSGIVLTGTLSSSGFNNVVNLPLTLQANPATVSVSGSLTMGGGLEVQGNAVTINGGSVTIAGGLSGTGPSR
jgi:hypothetical protein